MIGFTSPLAIPVGTYTPLDTELSVDGGAKAAEVDTLLAATDGMLLALVTALLLLLMQLLLLLEVEECVDVPPVVTG